MKIFEVAGVGKLHGLTVLSLDKFVDQESDELDEDWKSALGSAALAGAMAFGGGMGHAQAADLSNFNTQYLQQVASGEHPRPMVSVADAKAELQARANGKQQATAPARVDSPSGPQGFSKEYLQKASDPNRVGRYLISVEKAQELLKQANQGVAEGSSNNIPTIGINVRNDKDIDYASLIVDGKKKYESRKTDSLRPYVGKTVGIVRTGNGPAVAIGQVTIGEPIIVDAEKFNKLRNQHLVQQGSKFDIDSDSTKYLYPMINPVRWDNEKPIKSKGIVSRKIQEQGVAEGVRDLGYDAQSLIMKLRRDVEEKRLQPTRQAVLAAASELAGDMDFAPELLVQQVLGRGVAEDNSAVIANTADRLTDKDDGRTAKLRAAGDARREQHLKGRDIAKNDKSSKDAWGDLKEAPGDFGLGANYRAVPDAEMQDLLGRSKNKTKTKRDKYDYPYIHGSNIEVKDEAGKKFDTEKLKAAIMTRPANILGQNAKMQHSETGTEAIFDIGLPALKGLAVNEKTGEFVVVDTCPGAGACQTYCYAMKGSYVMFKAVSMGLARMLNFLLNDPAGFADKLNSEIASARSKYAKKGARIVVRWHDAGDFFSPEYMDMAYGVARANPDVGFYAYTKMGDVANAARPANFNMNFSQGAKSGQEKKVNITRTKHSKVVPKDMFFDLIARKGNELIKDAKGRMQFASPENLEKFKSTLAQKYAIDKNSILTYDQMMKTPVGDAPKWNVIVMPGDGDNSANRNDVVGSYLLFH